MNTLPGPTRQRRKQARPQELLDAALDLFVERGYAATRCEDVAARAGVSKGTLFLYFPSKEVLLNEVIRHNAVNRIAEGEALIRGFRGSSADLLGSALMLWWERIGETRASGLTKLMASEAHNFPESAQFYVDAVVAPAHRLLGQIIERGVAAGEFRGVDVEAVVHALVGPLVFLALDKHSLGACKLAFQIEPRVVIGTLVDLVVNGLLPRAAHPSPAPASTPTALPAVKKRRHPSP